MRYPPECTHPCGSISCTADSMASDLSLVARLPFASKINPTTQIPSQSSFDPHHCRVVEVKGCSFVGRNGTHRNADEEREEDEDLEKKILRVAEQHALLFCLQWRTKERGICVRRNHHNY